MAAPSPTEPVPGPAPKYLRAAYVSPGEGILREGRSTRLFHLPGPLLWLVVLVVLDYSALSAAHGWAPMPGLTGAFAVLPNSPLVGSYSLLGGATLLLLLLTLVGLLWFALRYLRWMRTVYAVTTNRVILQRGILSRDFDEIPVTKVRAIDVHQTFGQRILGYGTVRVTSEW
ncbi:MAG: PH domain-containing protein, partial [Thermoplasmata archaeon]